jgi:hypothetical protein
MIEIDLIYKIVFYIRTVRSEIDDWDLVLRKMLTAVNPGPLDNTTLAANTLVYTARFLIQLFDNAKF